MSKIFIVRKRTYPRFKLWLNANPALLNLHAELQPLSKNRIETLIMTIALTPLVSLIAGILILLMPKLLNYIVAGYLIFIGVVGLFGIGSFNLS